MGLFDWLTGKRDYGDLGAAPPQVQAPSLLPPGPAPAPMAAPQPAFGIESAIDLMRGLPFDENPELVLRVLRKTLRSTGVSVEQIIASAIAREEALTAEGSAQVAAIEQLEQQIAARRAEIDRLAAALSETKNARDRLQHAMENETKVAPLPPDVVLQIREEVKAEAAAAARAESAPPPPVSAQASATPPPVATTNGPSGHVPPAPKSMPPPLPRSAAMPPLPSKPPPMKPSKSVPPKGSPRSVRPPAVAIARAEADVPSLVDDEPQTSTHDAPNSQKK